MVDYSSTKTSGGGIGFFVAAAIVVLVLLYALFAGSGVSPTQDPANVAPIADDTAPLLPSAPATQ